MDLRRITPELSVSPQLSVSDLPALAAQGLGITLHYLPLYWDGMLKGREWLAEPEMQG